MDSSAVIAPHIKTIIWDLDGTLLDSFGIYRDCLNEVLRSRGRPAIPERILRNHHHGSIEESITNVLEEAGERVSRTELSAIISAFYVLDNAYITDADRHLFEDAIDLIERAHGAGKRQIVATNRAHGADRGNGSPRSLVAGSRLRSFVGDIVCGDDSAYRKPYRQFLEARFGEGLAGLGETVIIGDQFIDAELARNIGCAAVLVNRTEKIVHLDTVDEWKSFVQIVPSLWSVHLAG